VIDDECFDDDVMTASGSFSDCDSRCGSASSQLRGKLLTDFCCFYHKILAYFSLPDHGDCCYEVLICECFLALTEPSEYH